MQYDTLIRNALVIDGSNTPGYRADVAILNGRIERIGDLPDARASEEIDAAGRVLALANTPLGFRHGPKSTLNGTTLVVVLRSAQPLARRYEQDLLEELRRDGIAARVISVGPAGSDSADGDFLLDVPALPDPWLAPLWLVMAQCFALQRSAALGLTPDNPFPDGTVNRVVQGVTIHDHG